MSEQVDRSTKTDIPKVLKVLLEYNESRQQVIVRGVFEQDAPVPPPLEGTTQRNSVHCFLNIDHGDAVGLVNLVPASNCEE